MRYFVVMAILTLASCGGGDGDNSRSQIHMTVPWVPEAPEQAVVESEPPTVMRLKTVTDCVEVRDSCWRSCNGGGVLPDGRYGPIDQCVCRCTAAYWTCRSELPDPGLR